MPSFTSAAFFSSVLTPRRSFTRTAVFSRSCSRKTAYTVSLEAGGEARKRWRMDDFDDWGLTAEEFDSLEKEALKKVSERQSSSSLAATSSRCTPSPVKKLTVKIVADGPGKIALESPYDAKLLGALKTVAGGQWDKTRRVWVYPESMMANLQDTLSSLKDLVSQVQVSLPIGSPKGERILTHDASMDCSSPTSKIQLWQTATTTSGDPLDERRQDAPSLFIRLFIHASGNIGCKVEYHQAVVEKLRTIPKASWQARERLWLFPVSSLSTAEKVLSEINAVNVVVQKLDPLVQRALSAAFSVPDLQNLYEVLPSSIEAKLLQFQREGVRFILQHGGRALLADEMGLGKTLQAIAVSACLQESWPVLVLTPSSLRLHWASMIHQWLNISPPDIVVVLSQYGGSNRGGYRIQHPTAKTNMVLDGVFNIVSYDLVPKLQDVLMASKFKVVIADESHFLKNPQAKRTIASLPMLQKAKYTLLLTGTPALSRPIELFKQLEALYPDVYKSVHEYGSRYCKGGVFGMYQGASNHEELHNLMKSTVMIRRLKKDVLSQLPVKRRQQVFLELDEKEMKQIRPLFKELEALNVKIIQCKLPEEVESLKNSQKHLINKIYTISAEVKIPAVIEYLDTVVEAGCKFLIFAHHLPMIEAIHQFLLKKKVGCIRIDGKTPPQMRHSQVVEFQDKDHIKAAVLSIKAGGVGLTLTAADTVIFAELSWTPGDIIQAEDRAHRIGQVSSVNVYYLLANDTVDDIIWETVQNKLENLGQVLDGQEKSLEVAGSQIMSSPSKQTSLDSFLKRCPNPLEDDPEHNRAKVQRN